MSRWMVCPKARTCRSLASACGHFSGSIQLLSLSINSIFFCCRAASLTKSANFWLSRTLSEADRMTVDTALALRACSRKLLSVPAKASDQT